MARRGWRDPSGSVREPTGSARDVRAEKAGRGPGADRGAVLEEPDVAAAEGPAVDGALAVEADPEMAFPRLGPAFFADRQGDDLGDEVLRAHYAVRYRAGVDAEVGDARGLVYVQLARAPVVVQAVGDVAVLLDLAEDDAGSDRVHGMGGGEVGLAGAH